VDSKTLVILAWCSTLDLRLHLERKRREQPRKRLPQLLDEVLYASIDDALACFDGDPIYGPLWVSLARYGLASVDVERVTSAIALEGLIEPLSGVFCSDDPYVPARQSGGPADETEAFWQAVTAHSPLAQRLQRFSESWQGDSCRGSCELRAFFLWYLERVQPYLHMPFFLRELLRASLASVDWHAISARVLQGPARPACCCDASSSQPEPRGVQAQILGEVFRLVDAEIGLYSSELPEPLRTQALFLRDLCRETARALQSCVTTTGA